MIERHRLTLLSLLFVLLVATAGLSRPAQAGVSEATLALAGPLAEQFGVPASAVTTLLEKGVSLDSVTQLLLISQSSSSDLDDVTTRYRESGNDIDKTAEGLDVDPAQYSQERVTASIDDAKRTAQEDATRKATDGASDAIGNALGGLRR